MTLKTILETKRLILRLLTIDDFEAVHAWASDAENTRLMLWGPNTEAQTKTFLEGVKQGHDFAVVLKQTNVVIGSCGIYPAAFEDTSEVGWILHKKHWKNGYGTELAGELIRYGFEDLGLRRIIAEGAAENYGSRRVMERNGMRHEGTYIKGFPKQVDNNWVDAIGYAILAEEYFERT